MRGCLTFVVGVLLGAALMLYWWPKQPAAETAPQSPDLRIRLSDRYLARVIGTRVSGMGVSGVSVSSAPPTTMIASGTLSLVVASAPVSLQVEPVASGGTIHVNVVDLRVGNLPIPGGLVPTIGDSINRSVRSRLGRNAVVRSVRVTPGGLDVTADYR
jgi:hypothetical protein